MDKLIIEAKTNCKDSIARTIRMNGKLYDTIEEIADENNVSFNTTAVQLLEYAVDNVVRKNKRQ